MKTTGPNSLSAVEKVGAIAVAAALVLFVVALSAGLFPPKNAMSVTQKISTSSRLTEPTASTIEPSAAPPASPANPPPPDAPNMREISGEYFGCIDKDYYEKLAKYAADNDKDAWTTALMSGYETDQCVPFKPGEKVFITDTAVFSGLMQVRRQGETQAYWTVVEATR